MPLIPLDKCTNDTYTNYSPREVTPNMICAGFLKEGGQDVAKYDSGGPLVVPKGPNDMSAVIHGITSWTGKPYDSPKHPGVYTRVANFIQWIRSNMEENGKYT